MICILNRLGEGVVGSGLGLFLIVGNWPKIPDHAQCYHQVPQTELVQHTAYRGSSHVWIGATCSVQ